MTDQLLERVNRWLPAASVIVGSLLIAAVLLFGLWSRTAADNSSRVQESTDIAACRALARVPIDEARTDIEALILDYGSAAATDTPADDLDVFSRAADAKVRLTEATDAYKAALELSKSDPATFLHQCEAS